MIELQINTTQNVNIKFNAASLGERIVAFIVDYLLIAAYLIAMFYIAGEMGLLDQSMNQWSKIAVVSLLSLPALLYTLISEFFMNGQTLGKKIMKVKVVKLDGYQASALDYITRWIFRLVDIFLGFGTGGIAILSIALSKNSQRLGDMAAGTAVISLKDNYNINHTILEEVSEYYQPHYPNVINLSDRDMQIIKDMFTMAQKKNDFQMMIRLREKIEKTTNTNRGTKTDFEYITIIIKDYTHFTQHM